MDSILQRAKLIFLGLFAVISVALAIWQLGWVIPEKRCLEAHKWWDNSERVCAQPVLISDLTGRTIQDKQAAAAARKAIGREPAPAPKVAP
jgi:hypothetical protein